jgi:hypothetical protein
MCKSDRGAEVERERDVELIDRGHEGRKKSKVLAESLSRVLAVRATEDAGPPNGEGGEEGPAL